MSLRKKLLLILLYTYIKIKPISSNNSTIKNINFILNKNLNFNPFNKIDISDSSKK
jgi:hypothetical protein